MIQIKFWNPITGRNARVTVSGLNCPQCKKPITQKQLDTGKVLKHGRSFDLYHRRCFDKPFFKAMWIDESGEIIQEVWNKLKFGPQPGRNTNGGEKC